MPLFKIFRRRPLLVTPFSIWLKPLIKIKYSFINHWVYLEKDEIGRARVLIIDEAYRYFWVRLNEKQYRLFRWRCYPLGYWDKEEENG